MDPQTPVARIEAKDSLSGLSALGGSGANP